MRSVVLGILLCAVLLPGCSSAPETVTDPDTGQTVLADQLTVFASSEDIESIVASHNGEITEYIPATDTYQVQFPVETYEELMSVAAAIDEQGYSALPVLVIEEYGVSDPVDI